MAEELFTRIKDLEREIKESKDSSEANRDQVERFDESLRLYLTSVPLFVLGASIASVDYSWVTLPIVELISWALFLCSFLAALLQRASSSLLSHEIYDGIERMCERSEASQKVKLINEYVEKEESDEVRFILLDYLEDEKKRAEELESPPDTYVSRLVRKHKRGYEYVAEYGGSLFLLSLVSGFILLLVSRGASLWY